MEEMTTQSLRKQASKRIEWLDALKGVAIIAVVFGHSLLGYTENNAFGEYNDFFFQLKDWIYIWHMPFFMCLSGFSFSLAYYRDNKVDTLKEKLVNLKLFDYLIDDPTPKKVGFERSINIAGNLDVTKCGYISQLGQLEGVKVNLYGPNFDEKMRQCENINYRGSFPVDEIPNQLNKGFGLVWDGESIDGCKGLSGQYLRYNNPHKMSLYIASGLPIIIWKNAAQAKFVKENGIGICVENLKDIHEAFSAISEHEYKQMLFNVLKVRREVVNGEFTRSAIVASLNI